MSDTAPSGELDAEWLYVQLRPFSSWSINADRPYWEEQARLLRKGLPPARLIAAAPEQQAKIDALEATRDELIRALEPFARYWCDTLSCNCHNCVAMAAIAKARGETP